MPTRFCAHFQLSHAGARPAFTLLETLATVGIVAMLAALLLPALTRARDAATTLQCGANLRAIGQAFHAYMVSSKGVFPLAYRFNCNNYFPAPGITHWSRVVGDENPLPEKTLQCPGFDRGGLSPTDTPADNLEPGQSSNASCVDAQSPRCAYTVNEAVCPQPYFLADPPPRTPMGMCHYVGAVNVDLHNNRLYRCVRMSEVSPAAGTILASEWHRSWQVVSGPGYCNAAATVSLSYRPVHGFAPVNGNALDPYDVSLIPPAAGGPPQLRRLSLGEVSATSPAPSGWGQPRVNWLGRNHRNRIATNFLYVDGHVETKAIEQTVVPFEWGQRFYSLRPGDDVVGP